MNNTATAQALTAALAAAEAELSALSEQSREAYRRYRDLDAQQTAKATEVRELRAQLRAEESGEQS